MQDEKIEQEKPAPVHHEMSETPFGMGRVDQQREAEQGAAEPEKPESDGASVVQPESAEATSPVEEEQPLTMEDAMAMADSAAGGVDYSGTFQSLREGDVVDGVVVHIDREGVLVDVGTKSEGTVKLSELTRDQVDNPEDVVSVGEKIRVYVVQADSQDGGPVLSKKRADFENAWDRVEKAHQTGEVLKAMVTDRVKGGLVVDLGIRGFVPASHVGSGKLKSLDKFVGQSMAFKVIEVDRERRKVVLSNRKAVDEERESQRAETIATLGEGQIREGVVRRITDYGAFVDLGGVDGLLHISEMSWTRINHPTEVVKVGQKLQVMVLKLNLKEGRVSLGLRQILPDPWEDIKRIHTVGEVITGTVTRVVPFGAFVQVEGGVEGIIPNSELSTQRGVKPEEVVSSGQEVQVKVVDLRPEERRMTLSLRALQTQRERERDEQDYHAYNQTRTDSRTTIGDLFGEQLEGFAAAAPASDKLAKQTRRKRSGKAARMEELEEAEALAEVEEIEMEEPKVEGAAELEPAVEVEPEAEAEPEPTVEVEPEAERDPAVEPAPEAEAEAVEEAAAPEDAPKETESQENDS